MKLRKKKRDYIEEVRTNPNVYCSCVCCETYCEKHRDNLDIRKPYLLASMKGTPYCIAEDPEVYAQEDW